MLELIKKSCEKFPERNSFYINDQPFSYKTLSGKISSIRLSIEETDQSETNMVGVLLHDDIETYAAVFGILFAGKGFVPINPEVPLDRNASVIEQSEIKTILASKIDAELKEYCISNNISVINSAELKETPINLELPNISDESIAYLLFTSGSTGIPKGVPIRRKNLNAFIDAFFALGYQIDENDKFLQMFELTFDLSIMSYMVPLCKGACVYTVSPEQIKYMAIYSLLEDHEITFALMVPSILSYLKPYFDDIRLEKLKYSLFCGEALYKDIAEEWKNCVPNALLQNVYGPTEATIFCLTYDINSSESKEYKGILCIGKPMKNVEAIIVDENQKPLSSNQKGELCLYGSQNTAGYWKNPEKNKEAFFTITENGFDKTYYKTGDLAYFDENGDFLYAGRIDNQVKIDGFRVELSEIEHHAREFTKKTNVVAIAFQNNIGNTQIVLCIEKLTEGEEELMTFLKTKLPVYMIPSNVQSLDIFPLNINGKIDRKAIKKQIESTL
jgi:amino acid adenylation domain-containing protein